MRCRSTSFPGGVSTARNTGRGSRQLTCDGASPRKPRWRKQTMNICLEELRHCQHTSPRPNFNVLLGQRYSWCPLPRQITATESEPIHVYLPPVPTAPVR
jgi:hypothetical protein